MIDDGGVVLTVNALTCKLWSNDGDHENPWSRK